MRIKAQVRGFVHRHHRLMAFISITMGGVSFGAAQVVPYLPDLHLGSPRSYAVLVVGSASGVAAVMNGLVHFFGRSRGAAR